MSSAAQDARDRHDELAQRAAITAATDATDAASEAVRFDYAVVCCGSYYNNPFKHSARVISGDSDSVSSCSGKLRAAKSILVIGGGLVGTHKSLLFNFCFFFKKKIFFDCEGVEVAAELIEAGHWKNGITLATSSDRLMPRQPEAVAKVIMKFYSFLLSSVFIFLYAVLRRVVVFSWR